MPDKSKQKFEVLGKRELLEVPLPMVEVWEELQAQVEQLTGEAGLRIIGRDSGKRGDAACGAAAPAGSDIARGALGASVGLGDVWRAEGGGRASAGAHAHWRRSGTEQLRAVTARRTAAARGARRHRRGTDFAELSASSAKRSEGYGIEKSSVSREFVQASAAQLQELCDKKLQGLDLVAIVMDGIHLGKQVLVVALGIESSGEKHVLGLWQGATENTTVVKELLEDLVARGLDPERSYSFVIDGAKALRAGIERVFGERAEVQRCQIHKRRNVAEHLPKNAQGDYDRRIRNAYAMTEYAAAKAELEKIFRQLERVNPSAARSLEEGLEETLTVHRLGVGWLLRRTLAPTNPIESCLSTVERVARNVKRWREGAQALRWTATGLLEAQKKFRRVKGYRELEALQRRINPSLTQKARVA
jgi:hypothetical protein